MRIASSLFVASIVVACGGGSGPSGASLPDGGGMPPGADSGTIPPDGGAIAVDAGPPPPTCAPPIAAVDTSSPTTVVKPCTEAALRAAVAKGGAITFDCGGPATIVVASELVLPKGIDTVIDGGGAVTIDGGDATRILRYDGGDYRKGKTTITLQRLTLTHAKASGTPIPAAPPPCSQGTGTDGGGGAIWINDGELHVVGCTFDDDHAAQLGPDVAGGAIYATGSLGVVVVGSTFTGCSASNGGAIGMLNSDLTLANVTFTSNTATGNGGNTIDTGSCSANGGEVGDGGNGGALSIDGGSDGTFAACGATFARNAAGALAGAIFRTPDGAMQTTSIDRSSFDANTAAKGGGALYMHNSDLRITASTFSNGSAPGAGAIQADGTNLTLVNDTFASNHATKGLGGAISLFSDGGSITNCTFANNASDGGSGYFAAAIAGGASLAIANTIFASNTTGDGGSPMQCAENGTGSGDLQWPKDHVTGGAPDAPCASGITFADPKLGPLADNGGPTPTMLPDPSGPAIGAGASCPATDQRGRARSPAKCAAGAVEP